MMQVFPVMILSVFVLFLMFVGTDDSKNERVLINWYSECGCTGIEVESTNIFTSLVELLPKQIDLQINACDNRCKGLSDEQTKVLDRRFVSDDELDNSNYGLIIHVVHIAYLGVCGKPGHLKELRSRGSYSAGETEHYFVARTMYESDQISDVSVERCNTSFDEIWVPTHFNRDSFIKCGVSPNKIYVINEPLDVQKLYNPALVEEINLEKYFDSDIPDQNLNENKKPSSIFTFLSVFKWEERKNWKALLQAFAEEFCGSHAEPARLLIKTSRYMGSSPQMDATYFINWLHQRFPDEICSWEELEQKIGIVTDILPSNVIPSLYKSSDAFVLPTHGEGWGLPFAEAMSMGLPTIGTGWGGSTEFMNDDNSFLVDFELVPTSEIGHWADPDIDHLRSLMRYVAQNPNQSKLKGRKAREYCTAHLTGDAIGKSIIDRTTQIKDVIRRRKSRNSREEL